MTNSSSSLRLGDHHYTVEELPLGDGPSAGWAHHGVAVREDDTIVACSPDGGRLLELAPSGRRREVAVELLEMHGIRPFDDGGTERLFVADNGHKFVPGHPHYAERRTPGRVVALDLDGTIARELVTPPIDAYAERNWQPCAVAVDERRRGGSGDIFVADGYGESLLHRYSADGRWRVTIDGSSSGAVFATPHDVILDRRGPEPALYVADRANRRIVVLDLLGSFLRSFGDDVLTSPSGLAVSGSLLIVAELHGRLVAFDADDRVVGAFGADDHDRPGWPNALDGDGATVPYLPADSTALHAPHGLACDPLGVLYLTEWHIGGRLLKLTPRDA